MAATPLHLQESSRFGDQVETHMLEIERLADAGDWDKIESVLQRLPNLMRRIPESARCDILMATQRRVEMIHERAIARSDEIGGQLATLKTGRRAAASYQATGALSSAL